MRRRPPRWTLFPYTTLFRSVIARRHQHIHRAHGVDVEIVVGNRRGFVVRRLCGRVDDEVRPLAGEQIAHALAVADVEIEVTVAGNGIHQVADYRARGARRAEELLPHVVIDANYVPAFAGQQARALGADEPAGSGDHHFLGDG